MFPETMTFWGAFLNPNYGYNRGALKPGLSENTYIRRYWQGALELLAVMLDLYAASRNESLLRDKLLVLAPPILRFYREYYDQRDAAGHIRLEPCQSLETWHEAVNPAPDIAGLHWVLDGLLALASGELADELRTEWSELRSILPPLPTRTYGQRTEILPGLEYDQLSNFENPELYAVFPYRLFGVGKPDLEVALATWRTRIFKDTGGWRQDAIQAALLGLTNEAKAAVAENFSTWHSDSRFPAFWGPNFDWVPDQDHGSAASMALQCMLMQCDGNSIRLLPAWPEEWDVDFRLHAPGQTVVEARFEGGEIRQLKVSPEARRAAVESAGVPIHDGRDTKPHRHSVPAPEPALRPQLLRFADGGPVSTPEDWEQRRREIANAIIDIEYGGLPPTPAVTTVEILHTTAFNGLKGARFSSCRVHTGPDQTFSFLLTLLIPPGEGPHPVVLNGDACWRYANDEVVADVLARGFILAQFNRVELAPDNYTPERVSGLYRVYPDKEFGALAALAWGYHRCIDALTEMPWVDSARIGIVGHSRGGKASLLAGATDTRVTLTSANNSGAGGAGCFRIQGAGAETLADLMRAFPYWFGPKLREYLGREQTLPFDQHFLKALVAPRALLTTEALGDAWANPIGTWRTHEAARAMYRLLDAEPQLGIAFRPGGHAHGPRDWKTFLNFMEWRLCGKPAETCYNRSPFT